MTIRVANHVVEDAHLLKPQHIRQQLAANLEEIHEAISLTLGEQLGVRLPARQHHIRSFVATNRDLNSSFLTTSTRNLIAALLGVRITG